MTYRIIDIERGHVFRGMAHNAATVIISCNDQNNWSIEIEGVVIKLHKRAAEQAIEEFKLKCA